MGKASSGAGGWTSDEVVEWGEFDDFFDDMFVNGYFEKIKPIECTVILKIRPLTDFGISNWLSWFEMATVMHITPALRSRVYVWNELTICSGPVWRHFTYIC